MMMPFRKILLVLVMLPAFIAVLIALTMLLLGVEIQIDGHSIYVLIAPWEL